ncbi:MAG TPA: chain length determinant protein tyrosine kinase EpsG [Burkholderiales bacterium]|nr:chain length determinant protein tyrosine kinase EpsG [Burkholderiales bacterium]
MAAPTENVLPLETAKASLSDRAIGAILVDDGKLRVEDAEKVLLLQKEQGLRFGEAALKLGLITDADLRYALSKQHDYPYLPPGHDHLGKELVAAYEPFGRPVEELRILRTQLLLRWFNAEAGRNMVAIVSPGSGEGRSYLAANLAVIFAQLGEHTLLIDADLRAPRQHRIFNLEDRSGLSAILSGRGDYSAIAPISALLGLSVLTAGAVPPNPQELLMRGAFSSLLREARTRFDVVILDTPASAAYADAHMIAAQAGGAVVLARKDHTRLREVRDVTSSFGNAGIKIIGTVITAF